MQMKKIRNIGRTIATAATIVVALAATTNVSQAQFLDLPISELRFHVITGEDDMRRGGYAIIRQKFKLHSSHICGGSRCGDRLVRLSGGIPEGQPRTVRMSMKNGTTLRHLGSFRIEVNRGGGFGGGIGGDNWNVRRVAVTAHFVDGRSKIIFFEEGRPVKRFTGQDKKLERGYPF